jgi:type II secretory pathway pseudopilin PulG
MNTERVKDRGGFTILEALIASSVFIIVSGAIISLFIYGSNLWQLIITQSELRSDASGAIYSMTKELQSATRISTQTPSPNLIILSSNSIKFYLPKINTDGSPKIKTDGSTDWDTDTNHDIQYQYISASKQLRRSTQGVSKVICDNVASIEFENSANNDGVKIILKVEKNTLMGIKSTTLTSMIKLRN